MPERLPEAREAAREERRELQERLADWLDVPLSVLALVMLGLLILEFTVPLSPGWARRVGQAQTVIWVVFLATFLLELGLAPSKLDYLKKNWLTAIAVALPALRTVRLLRVARALRGISLVRIVTTLNRGSRALGHVVQRGQFGYVLLLTLLVTTTAAAGAYYLERDEPSANITTPGDALWWAVTLVTTVNSPFETVTLEGRVIALFLRIFGLAVSGYLTAIIAVYLLGNRAAPDDAEATQTELRQLRLQLTRLARVLEGRGVDEAHGKRSVGRREAP